MFMYRFLEPFRGGMGGDIRSDLGGGGICGFCAEWKGKGREGKERGVRIGFLNVSRKTSLWEWGFQSPPVLPSPLFNT